MDVSPERRARDWASSSSSVGWPVWVCHGITMRSDGWLSSSRRVSRARASLLGVVVVGLLVSFSPADGLAQVSPGTTLSEDQVQTSGTSRYRWTQGRGRPRYQGQGTGSAPSTVPCHSVSESRAARSAAGPFQRPRPVHAVACPAPGPKAAIVAAWADWGRARVPRNGHISGRRFHIWGQPQWASAAHATDMIEPRDEGRHGATRLPA
jgi:hypothetical protein